MSGPTYTTSQVAAFEDAVIALLKEQDALAGVQVAVGPLGDDTANEYIQSLGASATQDWSAMGNLRKRENLELTLEVATQKPGGGEAVIKAARNRVVELVTAVELALRAGVSVPDVGPIKRVQIDVIAQPARGVGSDRTSRMEIRQLTVTGYADLKRL